MPRISKKQLPAAEPSPVNSLSDAELHTLIAKRAYEISCQRADWAGDELSDWLNAELEVLAELARPLPSNVVPLAAPAERPAAVKKPRPQTAVRARQPQNKHH